MLYRLMASVTQGATTESMSSETAEQVQGRFRSRVSRQQISLDVLAEAVRRAVWTSQIASTGSPPANRCFQRFVDKRHPVGDSDRTPQRDRRDRPDRGCPATLAVMR